LKEKARMLAKVHKWGNSQGLRFSKTILKEAQITVGDEVNITVQDGKIIIETVNRMRNTYNLEELVSKIPKDYRTEEVDWDPPSGKEEW
jgi:antitoxin MazE